MADEIPTIGTKGARLDLLIRQGATCGPNFTQLKDAGGAAIDLTNEVITGQLRKTADDGVVLATISVSIVDAVAGSYNWEFTSTATAALTADPVDEFGPDSLYVWDMEMKNTLTNRVRPLVYGDARVFREVTKP